MKNAKRITALVLAFLITVSSVCVTVFAAGEAGENLIAKYKKGTGYLAFGDSITRGYGASDNWDYEGYNMDNTDNPNCRNVTGSYPKLIAEALNLYAPDSILDKSGEYWPIAADGLSTAYFIDLLGLEDNFYDSVYLYENNTHRTRYTTSLEYFGDPLSLNPDGVSRYQKTGTGNSVRYLVKNSHLITIAVGMADTLNRARTLATKGVDISKTDGIVSALKKFAQYLAEGYAYWAENFPLILDYIKANAPEDGSVVIIGCLNPVNNMTISDDYLVPVGSLISMYTELMNKQYRKWADEYGFIYVDISSVETGSSENDISIIDFIKSNDRRFQGIATHPTPTGYKQIAKTVLYALEQKDAAEQEAKTTVKIDLGRITDVDYVIINGRKSTDYTVENGVLSIKLGSSNVKSLTVASHDGSKVALSVYSLSYNNGYSSYRLYTTNDVLGAVTKTTKSVVSVAKNAIGKLFKK